jgi:hypothetical protein
LRAFFGAIRGEGPSGFVIDDAFNSLRIIEAAHESARTGRTMSLSKDAVEKLKGLRREVWEGIDVQTYIDQERDAW